MRFYQFILKNVLQRKARSALTVLGVAIAVAAVVALVGIADGFQRAFGELYERRGVDLVVVRAGSSERLSSSIPQGVGEQIRCIPGVYAVSPGLMDLVAFVVYYDLLALSLRVWRTPLHAGTEPPFG